MNIVLTGFMGSGKSSVGKQLADVLGFGFIDTDQMIEQDVGMPITKIFQFKGEPYFRKIEARAIALVSMLDRHVIATGGGVPMNENNMHELEKNSVIVHLQVTPETVLKRIGHDHKRPLLKTKDPLATAREILRKRQRAYERCSLAVPTDNHNVDAIVQTIVKFFREHDS
ncbi:MAG: shikimate kinase [Elusimicrobia bacterium]|nr:shikimate kinase [Elusimicrobiota bacterium]MBD3412756.1 shikimate kinase [Elusimicrobiota bacterium]